MEVLVGSSNKRILFHWSIAIFEYGRVNMAEMVAKHDEQLVRLANISKK
jgi:hypothetical protein